MKSLAILLISLVLFASPAWAIPVAGTYVFATGDPNISGSFTSTGSQVSAWSFSGDILYALFPDEPRDPYIVSWSSDTDFVAGNTAERFVTGNNWESFGYYADFTWNADPSVLSAVFRLNAICCDWGYYPPPTVSFAHSAQSVPEPGAFWLLVGGLGMVVLIRRIGWVRQGL